MVVPQANQRRAGANHAGTQVRQPAQIAHHHLQHVLLPPVQMGAEEDIPQPDAQPTDLLCSGEAVFIPCP